ncbi:hypothetical protein BDZ89DRAFT_1122157 [Hymenopellis radicata]|nr:hypothetical protein BDZ89DRAFT_1122157 [Hymenopellis radicata]
MCMFGSHFSKSFVLLVHSYHHFLFATNILPCSGPLWVPSTRNFADPGFATTAYDSREDDFYVLCSRDEQRGRVSLPEEEQHFNGLQEAGVAPALSCEEFSFGMEGVVDASSPSKAPSICFPFCFVAVSTTTSASCSPPSEPRVSLPMRAAPGRRRQAGRRRSSGPMRRVRGVFHGTPQVELERIASILTTTLQRLPQQHDVLQTFRVSPLFGRLTLGRLCGPTKAGVGKATGKNDMTRARRRCDDYPGTATPSQTHGDRQADGNLSERCLPRRGRPSSLDSA